METGIMALAVGYLWLINKKLRQSVGQSFSQSSISQSVCVSVCLSARQSISRSVVLLVRLFLLLYAFFPNELSIMAHVFWACFRTSCSSYYIRHWYNRCTGQASSCLGFCWYDCADVHRYLTESDMSNWRISQTGYILEQERSKTWIQGWSLHIWWWNFDHKKHASARHWTLQVFSQECNRRDVGSFFCFHSQ